MKISPEEARAAAAAVAGWIKSGERVRQSLKSKGPLVVKQACATKSLRELSRRAGLSPTYLSRVATGQAVISPGAFLKVVGEIDG